MQNEKENTPKNNVGILRVLKHLELVWHITKMPCTSMHQFGNGLAC